MSVARGEDGLTASERMEIFGKLPLVVRRVLAEAPYSYDVRDIRKAWDDQRSYGLSPRRFAQQLQDDFEQQRQANQSLRAPGRGG